jgi:hypothetical protein
MCDYVEGKLLRLSVEESSVTTADPLIQFILQTVHCPRYVYVRDVSGVVSAYIFKPFFKISHGSG